MQPVTSEMRVAILIGDAIRDSCDGQVLVEFPDTGREPFSVVRFKPRKEGAVPVDVVINFDLTYQIEAGRYTMHESFEPRASAEVVKEVVAAVLAFARSGLSVTRRWPALGKFSPTAIGIPGTTAQSSAAGWRLSKVSESWSPWG